MSSKGFLLNSQKIEDEASSSSNMGTEAYVIDELRTELQGFGLTRNEAVTYIYLLRTGAKKAGEVSRCTGINRPETYNVLTCLQNKGLISSTFDQPLRFIAAPLQKALDLLVSVEGDRLRFIEKRKDEVLTRFNSISRLGEAEQANERFVVLSGRRQNYSTATNLIKRAKSSVYIVAPEHQVSNLYLQGFFDLANGSSSGLDIRIVSHFTRSSSELLHELASIAKIMIFGVRLRDIPNFILVDSSEILFFASKQDPAGRDLRTIYTNHGSMADALLTLFDFLWTSGKPLRQERSL